ncbi:MAG: cell division protein ZapA [Ruminococcus sp.]|nr:cell division protein ZapA [Ruminococcus sp.]
MKNKLKIKVFGRNYTLVSEETQVYTDKLASALDNKLRQILKASPSLSITDAAVLASLEAYDELSKARSNIENIRSQIKGYVDDAARSKNDADNCRKRIFELERQVKSLEDELEKRTVVKRVPDDEVINAKDLISQEIDAALKSPVYPDRKTDL